jgi:hypothetical protein
VATGCRQAEIMADVPEPSRHVRHRYVRHAEMRGYVDDRVGEPRHGAASVGRSSAIVPASCRRRARPRPRAKVGKRPKMSLAAAARGSDKWPEKPPFCGFPTADQEADMIGPGLGEGVASFAVRTRQGPALPGPPHLTTGRVRFRLSIQTTIGSPP